MSEVDKEKEIAVKALMAEQKEEKKFKKAVKAKKTQAEELGFNFDKNKARAEVLKELAAAKSEKENAGEKPTSLAQADHEVDAKLEKTNAKSPKKSKRSAKDALEEEPPVKRSKKFKNSPFEVKSSSPIQDGEVGAASPKKKKKSKHSSIKAKATTVTQEVVEKELTVKKKKKKSKSTPEGGEVDELPTKKKAKKSKSFKDESDISPPSQSLESIEITVKSSKKKAKETESPQVTNPVCIEEKSEKKRARKQAIAERKSEKQVEKVSMNKQGKELKGNSAEQWNPDALSGDAARKSKFLRLLGAGKTKDDAAAGNGAAKKSKQEIDRVQNELERQYEAGIKLKHGMGAKRMGLGA